MNFELFFLILSSFAILSFYLVRYWSPILTIHDKLFFIGAIFLGLASIGLSLGLQIIFFKFYQTGDIFFNSFFRSALIEEISKYLFIYLFFRFFKIHDYIFDGIFFGILIGAIFGFIENLFYIRKIEYWENLLRSLTSVVIHLINGGIAGYFITYFLILKKQRFKFLLNGILLVILIHGLFNYSLLKSEFWQLLMPILIIFSYIYLEFLITTSQSTLPASILKLIGLDNSEYTLLKKFIKYELWFYEQQKTRKKYIQIFREIEFKRKIFVVIFYLLGILSLLVYFFDKNLIENFLTSIKKFEYISIFVVYPFTISISILFRGIINPKFFEKKVLRVPFLCCLNIKSKSYSEDSVLFYLSHIGFFVNLEKPKDLDKNIILDFEIAGKKFNRVPARIIWVNENKEEIKEKNFRLPTSGAIIFFISTPWKLFLFWNYKRITHSFKNLYLSLKEQR